MFSEGASLLIPAKMALQVTEYSSLSEVVKWLDGYFSECWLLCCFKANIQQNMLMSFWSSFAVVFAVWSCVGFGFVTVHCLHPSPTLQKLVSNFCWFNLVFFPIFVILFTVALRFFELEFVLPSSVHFTSTLKKTPNIYCRGEVRHTYNMCFIMTS